MSAVYERLGVATIVNAKGPATRLSGALMPQEVADAMREASQHCADIAELQARAGAIIAETTGAEAGLVASGAAAGLLLGTAACITGLDPGRMNRLPDTTGMKNEIVMVRSQRNFYGHAVRGAGIRLVEVGLADRFSGTGVRDAEAWEIADAITERTAAVHYVATPWSLPTLPEVVRVAHAAGVPVLVDAAAQLPPAENLRRFIAEGADLVAFSGGNAIRARRPPASFAASATSSWRRRSRCSTSTSRGSCGTRPPPSSTSPVCPAPRITASAARARSGRRRSSGS